VEGLEDYEGISVPGVCAAGDVRVGSIERCATAVGEGATVVRFVHEHPAPVSASR
jgi:thioredoxin reductase (NADPH)